MYKNFKIIYEKYFIVDILFGGRVKDISDIVFIKMMKVF